jgi:hypothetical protein
MGYVVSILQGLNLLVSFIVPTLTLAHQIKSHFELDPDFSVNIKTLSGAAVAEDDATIDEVNAWRASVGLKPLTPSQ